MKVSYGFRLDLEHQLVALIGEIDYKLNAVGRLRLELEGARDRLALLSKNSLKRFDGIIRTTSNLIDEAGEFKMYLKSLKYAIDHRDYDSTCKKYAIIHELEQEGE